jgi:hypothetical protein
MTLLYLINFFLGVSTSIALSLSPLLITETLGLSLFAMGIIDGICELAADCTKSMAGLLISKFGKKNSWISIGVVFSILSKQFLLIGSTLIPVFFSRLFERVSNGAIAVPRDVFTAELSPIEQRGKFYGKVTVSKTLGCFIGPVILSWWCSDSIENKQYVILTASIFAIIWGLCITVFSSFLKETPVSVIKPFNWNKCKSLFICFGLFMLGRFQDGLLILYLKDIGCSPTLYLATIGIFNYVSAMTASSVGKLTDKGYIRSLLYACVLSLMAFNLCFLNKGPTWTLILGIAFWGFQRSSFQIIFDTVLSRIVPLPHLGTAFSIASIIKAITTFTSFIMAGFLAGYSYSWVFMFSFIASGLTLLTIPRKTNEIFRS